METKTKKWLLVIIWACFIFFLSHQPDLQSGLPGKWDFILRKLAHVTEYGILTYLLIQAISQRQISKRKTMLISILLALLFALSDEYHQSFIVGRNPAARDVLIDSVGIIIASFILAKKKK